jgi:hypothetical protein
MDETLKRLALMAHLFLFCCLLSVPAHATDAAGSSDSSNHSVLVELFTSEGCSSCPPADALLREINGMKTRAGQLIVGISEHVTYWNGLGWSDPYSSEIYTARQNAYGGRFRLDSVYTPQMVINGDGQIVGSDRRALERALQDEDGRSQIPLHILSTKIANGVLNLTFAADGTKVHEGTDIIAVLADDVDRSTVLRGENSGQTLAHVAVARSLARVATVHGPTEKTVRLPLPGSVFVGERGHYIILFAQTAGLGQVIGIDSKPI